MKKLLSFILLGMVAFTAFPAAAQNAPQKSALSNLIDKATHTIKSSVADAAHRLAANKRALQSLPAEAKTIVKFRIIKGFMVDGERVYLTLKCPALFLDYKEADGLGNATVAMQPKCVANAIEKSFSTEEEAYRGVMLLDVYAPEFENAPELGNDLEYVFGDELTAQNKRYPKLKLVTNEQGSMYIYHLALSSDYKAEQKVFKKLFPDQKSFITAEKAVRALSVM